MQCQYFIDWVRMFCFLFNDFTHISYYVTIMKTSMLFAIETSRLRERVDFQLTPFFEFSKFKKK